MNSVSPSPIEQFLNQLTSTYKVLSIELFDSGDREIKVHIAPNQLDVVPQTVSFVLHFPDDFPQSKCSIHLQSNDPIGELGQLFHLKPQTDVQQWQLDQTNRLTSLSNSKSCVQFTNEYNGQLTKRLRDDIRALTKVSDYKSILMDHKGELHLVTVDNWTFHIIPAHDHPFSKPKIYCKLLPGENLLNDLDYSPAMTLVQLLSVVQAELGQELQLVNPTTNNNHDNSSSSILDQAIQGREFTIKRI